MGCSRATKSQTRLKILSTHTNSTSIFKFVKAQDQQLCPLPGMPTPLATSQLCETPASQCPCTLGLDSWTVLYLNPFPLLFPPSTFWRPFCETASTPSARPSSRGEGHGDTSSPSGRAGRRLSDLGTLPPQTVWLLLSFPAIRGRPSLVSVTGSSLSPFGTDPDRE